jgi:cytochrome P450
MFINEVLRIKTPAPISLIRTSLENHKLGWLEILKG